MDNRIPAYTSSTNTAAIEESVFSSQPTSEIERNLQRWIDILPYGENEEREVAKSRILDAYNNNKDCLDLCDLGLSCLPEGVFPSLTISKLELSCNQLSNLPDNVFTGMSTLKELMIYGNQLTRLSEKAFSGLMHLQKLYLFNNQLSDLPEQIFYELKNLRLLDLSINQLKDLPNRVFAELTELRELYLSSNQLKILFDGIFSKLSNLEILECSTNPLQEISGEAFAGLVNLQALHLEANELRVLPDNVFSELTKLKTLDLSANQLIALPNNAFARLVSLQELDCRNNDLSTLAETVLLGLSKLKILRLSENKLSALPAGLFADTSALENLYLNDNQLTTLPEDVFCGLNNLLLLNLSHNQLREVPENTFSSLECLKTLDFSYNQFVEIPEKTFEGLNQLKELIFCINRLTQLHENVFAPLKNLEQLYLETNQLSHLPEKMTASLVKLQVLGLEGNQLRNLPSDITTTLSSECTVYVGNNPLSTQEIANLRSATQIAGYAGPQIYFSMETDDEEEIAIPLHEVVKAWFDKANVPFAEEVAQAWQAIHHEPCADSFAQFLKKLMDDNVNNSSNLFAAEMVKWLERLSLKENQELRGLIFPVALEGLGSCEDRVSLTLNQMKNAEVTFDVKHGKYDDKLEVLIGLARQQFRLDVLERIAAAKIETLPIVDPIEVYLAYQVQLHEKLCLELGADKMFHFDVSGVTEDDLQAAELQVKQAENNDFKSYFATWEPWQAVLTRHAPDAYQQLQHTIYSASESWYAEQQAMLLQGSATENTEANRLQIESESISALQMIKNKYHVELAEQLLQQQPALLDELNKQVWPM